MTLISFGLWWAHLALALACGPAEMTVVERVPLCGDDLGGADDALAAVSLLQTAIELTHDTAKPGAQGGPEAPGVPGAPRLAAWLPGLLVFLFILVGFMTVVKCIGLLKGSPDDRPKAKRTVIKGPAIFLNKATVVEGPIVFASGQLPVVPGSDGKPQLVDAGIKPQADRCLKNMTAVLAEAGTDLKNCLKVSIFLTDIADFAAFNEVYVKYFDDPDNCPARTAIAVASLPVPGAKVEIECFAAGGARKA